MGDMADWLTDQALDPEYDDSRGEEERHMEPVACPFKVLVDSAEGLPYEFRSIIADAKQQNRHMVVTTEIRCLGRHPDSLGDYSIEGHHEFGVHVERKSVSDIQGTLLGFGEGDRRERFECELRNLATCESSLVVVEGTFEAAINIMHEFSTKDDRVNAKILMRSMLAMMQDYRVPWLFCDSRELAETATFRFLERFWRKKQERRKRSLKILKEM